ncbi:ninjurin-B [Musca vetustissima]|uniref:ninjurin-B n=1 Tax=Musca vetustissima TaxID=27455 RepID=UPI002AB6B1CA|nr:ninjurin-B [Musca vetustissima]
MAKLLNVKKREVPTLSVSSSTSSADQSIDDDDDDISEMSDKCCSGNDNKNTVLGGDSAKKSASKTSGNPYKITIEEPNGANSYAGNKNIAEGLMDISLLAANANQLRFLITYNHDASTYYISMALVSLSLIMQITVGIALIFKRRFRRCRNKRYNEFILGGVFVITVVNILLAAFTTTKNDVK